ncbi:MAG: hypothetical protein ABJD68_02745 [Nakamurella sp.]
MARGAVPRAFTPGFDDDDVVRPVSGLGVATRPAATSERVARGRLIVGQVAGRPAG